MIPAWLTDTITSDLDRALHYTLLWGLEGVELRTVGRASDRVPFVNEEKLKRRLREHDVPVVAVVPGLFEGAVTARAVWLNEVMQLRETLRFCTRIGCTRIVVSAFAQGEGGTLDEVAEALRRAGEQAARHQLTIAVLNEEHTTCATGRSLAAMLDAADHPAVRAAWNPMAAVQSGENPEEGLGALSGRVVLVRCGNLQSEDAAWVPAGLHEGVIDWSAQLSALARQGFEGPVSLEVRQEPLPKHGLRMATDLIQMLREISVRT